MPSRKQRRRRQKDRRHEYEYVLVDDEGREVPVDEAAEPRRGPERKEARPAAAKGGRGSARQPARGGRAARVVEPPSWRRVGKRSLIFAPLMFLTVMLLNSKQSTASHLVTTGFLLVFFVPFQFVMDSIVYRSYVRRQDKPEAGGSKSTRRRP